MTQGSWPQSHGVFDLGDFTVQSGEVMRAAQLEWKTHGTLSAARDNVIVYPTSYGAQHPDLEWLIGPDRILDPTRWFIVIPDMFSNGRSSSAATHPDFPSVVTSWDNVQAQKRLLAEQFGISRIHASYGFSMGAQQAYHWAAAFPDDVDHAIIVCGSARTADHNKVFLSGLLRILEAAPEHLGDGRFSAEATLAKRAFGHVYAGWGLSQDFYRAGLYKSVLGAPDLETFLATDWGQRFEARPAANLYAQAVTWMHGDISHNPLYGDDLPLALSSIKARVLLLPSETDLYFRVADHTAELAHLKAARLSPIPSIWGHRAGSPSVIPADEAFIRDEVKAWIG